MTQHEIVALRCPSCGSGITEPSREKAFGAEFRCDVCGIASVLIVDRALVPLSTLQKAGEKVCVACGRVAQREARFCQEGHPLVRKCIKCLHEFAVDHQRCDSCGWIQNVKPGTVEGEALAFDQAVHDVADPSYSVLWSALRVVSAGGGSASKSAATAAVAAILQRMNDPSFDPRDFCIIDDSWIEDHCWKALSKLGPEARQALPMLRQRIEESNNSVSTDAMLKCLVAISPEDALAYYSRRLEEGDKDDLNNLAVQGLFAQGNAAIPTLEKFCGIFSGRKGKSCAAAVTALRNGEKTLNLSSL